jgi:predicted esterase YcpF (UPF0227 family)
MSKDMSQEEANLAVATALMREALALREENNRLTKAIRLQADAIRTLHMCEETEINRLRKLVFKAQIANFTLDSERAANALLTEDNERLTAEVERLRAELGGEQ